MKTQLKKIQKGFTLVEIMIVVAIIGLLVAIALPNFMIARKKSQIKAAQASMKQIEGAVEQARLDDVTVDNTDLTIVDSNVTDLGNDLVPTYLKITPNPPGKLSCEFDNGSNYVSCILDGVATTASDDSFTSYTPQSAFTY